MTVMADFNYGSENFPSRAAAKGRNRTVLGSDFEYKSSEFTSQAIGNRQKRHQRITPIIKWEFQKDTLKMMAKIRVMKPVVDSGPPKRRNVAQTRRYREEHEQIRLCGIEKENHEMLDRLRKIYNRPRSTFCHLKRRGDPLVKGDAFRLPPPTSKGHYLVEMYKKLKLSNPMNARKSIRIQQEMLTSALDLVKTSNKNIPSEEMVESEVQSTLAKEDAVLPEPEPKAEQLSPVEVVQAFTPNIDAKVIDELVMAELSPTQTSESSLESPQSLDTNVVDRVEASPSESPADMSQTSKEDPSVTTQSMDVGVTPGETQTGTGNDKANKTDVSANLVESRPFG